MVSTARNVATKSVSRRNSVSTVPVTSVAVVWNACLSCVRTLERHSNAPPSETVKPSTSIPHATSIHQRRLLPLASLCDGAGAASGTIRMGPSSNRSGTTAGPEDGAPAYGERVTKKQLLLLWDATVHGRLLAAASTTAIDGDGFLGSLPTYWVTRQYTPLALAEPE